MFSLFLTLALAAAAPETATPPAADSNTTTAAPEKEKLICRTVRPSNSRLAKRECRTQKEWNEASDKLDVYRAK